MKHLWEVEHDYHCGIGCGQRFASFTDFLEEWGDADLDYNLLFRWDWEEETVAKNDREKNGSLCLCWMLQREGHPFATCIDVCRADEDAVITFLQPRLQHMLGLWEPLLENGEI